MAYEEKRLTLFHAGRNKHQMAYEENRLTLFHAGTNNEENAKRNRTNELMRMMLEMDKLKTKLDANLQNANRYYDNLRTAYDAAIENFTIIEPKLDKSKRDADICHVAGNTGTVVGGILAGVGIFAAPLTFGASVGLTAAGAGLMGAGATVTVGAMLGNSIVKKMNYNDAKSLLDKFEHWKTQLFEEIKKVYEISIIINEKRNLDKYKAIFEIMFPENSVQYQIVNAHFKNPELITKYDILRGLNGSANMAKGVYLFLNLVDDISIQGARVTRNAVTKILIPVGIVMDTGFLIASIVELSKKCDVAKVVGLMKETIQNEIETIDDLRSTLYYNRIEESMNSISKQA